MGVVLDLQPQTADVHVHDLQLAEVVPAPDAIQNLLPGQGLAGVVHEQLDDGVFHLGQLDALAVLLQRPVPGVEQEGRLSDLTAVHLLLLPAAARRYRASTRAVSSAGEKGLVT